MEKFGGLDFKKFEENDVGVFTEMFKKAFDKDSQIHLGRDGGPPGYENGNFLKEWFLHNSASAYAVFKDGKPIGGVNVFINNETHENFLGNIFVDPDLQNKGFGLIIWNYIEHKYPETKKWITDTPGFSYRNHHFYVNKCGFKIFHINDPKNRDSGEPLSGYCMEKIMNN
jgi:GNAT superfamily N-acetyltransferase